MSSNATTPVTRIGKYQLLAHIASGGMGVVYKARDEQLGRIVALKVLDPELAKNPILVERFQREARHAARLNHKNIVILYESDQADGYYYLSMEYIEGIDLADYIRRKGQLDPEEARRILIQACKALEHAHSHKITHRDIKPSNFLLANEEGRCRVKLTDFGLARLASEVEEDRRVTRAGTTVGTVDYMAPEQARDSGSADIRSDIYSLGCSFYHMLAGQPPFGEGTLGERIYKHIAADPPDVRQFNPAVTASLWTILRRMLAKHPDDRFQTPTELIQALRSLSPTTPNDPESFIGTKPSRVPNELTDQPAINSLTGRPPSSHSSHTVVPAPEPPKLPKQPKLSKRPTTLPELRTVSEAKPEDLGISPEQRQAAMAQYERAMENMKQGGDPSYTLQLLLACCRLDPTNLLYRKMLRQIGRDSATPRKSSWWSALFNNVPARSQLHTARKAGRHREVLDLGEQVLTQLPGDLPTQLAMAESAHELRLESLALWLLEQARADAPDNVEVLRRLANQYEHNQRFNQAIAIWERLREIDPSNPEFGAKIREIAVNETLTRGNYTLRDRS
jgi:serine/threonine protein kinase